MLNEIVISLASGLSLGSLIGIFAKSALDKQRFRFTKVFDFKERRYQAISILMLAAVNPSGYSWDQLRLRRPEIAKPEDLDDELKTEYYNAMIFASDKVLRHLQIFLEDKTLASYGHVAEAMREDLYH